LFPGSEIDFDGTNVKSISLLGPDKQLIVKIERPSSYDTLMLYAPAPLKMVKKFKLVGTVLGIPIEEIFNYESEAKSRLDDLDLNAQKVDVKIIPVDVPEEE
jgi:hypothetical protein